jgi:Uma2 family endonuclease
VRAPDFGFISNARLPAEAPTEAFWPGTPDLAVEVLSSNDRTGDVDEKIDAWLGAGCAAVWIIDPKLETVTVYHSRTKIEVLTRGDILRGDPVVPGFSCAVAELFQ